MVATVNPDLVEDASADETKFVLAAIKHRGSVPAGFTFDGKSVGKIKAAELKRVNDENAQALDDARDEYDTEIKLLEKKGLDARPVAPVAQTTATTTT